MSNLDKCETLYSFIRIYVFMKENCPEMGCFYVGWYIQHNSQSDEFELARCKVNSRIDTKSKVSFRDIKVLKVSEIQKIVCMELDYDNGIVYDANNPESFYEHDDDPYEAEYYESKLRSEDNCKML